MHDLYLRFVDQQQAEAILAGLGIVPDNSLLPLNGVIGNDRFDLDLLFGTGTIHSDTGVLDSEGDPVSEAVSGFHLNMIWRGNPPEALEPYRLEPQTPAVCWS
jgi:hypothetical protein